MDAYECGSIHLAVSLWELWVWVVKQFPGHKHTLEVALLWFEVSLPVGPFSSHSRLGRHVYLPPFRLVCAGLASSPGVWLQSSFESILSQLTASITCLLSPHYAGLPLLIKQAHNTTFLAFFMCRLLSPFHMHGWVAQRNVDHTINEAKLYTNLWVKLNVLDLFICQYNALTA